MNGEILKVRGLTKSNGTFKLKDISFSLGIGSVMGFIGPNGAGKSTTIKLIMNLMKRDSGEILIFGEDNSNNNKKLKNKIGFVYDENIFYGMLTINEMKNIISRFYKNWDENRFKQCLKDFGLESDKKIDNLSKGMKIKFSLAAALSHNAELIIMDEPTSGLDPAFRSELLDILSGIVKNQDTSIFFSTHITSDLEKIADQITFINNGEQVFSKPIDDVFKTYSIVKGQSESLTSDIKKYFIGSRKTSSEFEALTMNADEVRKAARQGITIGNASLEDILVYTSRGEFCA